MVPSGDNCGNINMVQCHDVMSLQSSGELNVLKLWWHTAELYLIRSPHSKYPSLLDTQDISPLSPERCPMMKNPWNLCRYDCRQAVTSESIGQRLGSWCYKFLDAALMMFLVVLKSVFAPACSKN